MKTGRVLRGANNRPAEIAQRYLQGKCRTVRQNSGKTAWTIAAFRYVWVLSEAPSNPAAEMARNSQACISQQT